jgi:GT2 family glycosyltransferase
MAGRKWWPIGGASQLRWRPLRRSAMTSAAAHRDPDFTIVISTCNRPDMLPRALASALAQTYDRYDIIVVDDASDDPARIDNPGGGKVRLVRSPLRLGFAATINLAASLAKGRWIAFLDDDDEYGPDLLSRTHAVLTATPDCRFSWCSTVFVHYEDGRPVRETVRRFAEQYESEEALLRTTVSVGSGYGFTVNRETFNQVGGFDDHKYWAIADTEFLYRLIAAGHRPAVVGEPLMRVHKHAGPRMTSPISYRNRARQCEELRQQYALLLAAYPSLGEAVRDSIEQLSALALALESQQPQS